MTAGKTSGDGRRAPSGGTYRVTITGREISAISLAFEAVSGVTAGDLVPDAVRMTATDPDYWVTAAELCEKFDKVLPPGLGTNDLRELIIRGAKAAGAGR